MKIVLLSIPGRCAFGIDTDMQNDINNPYLKKAAEVFENSVDEMFLFRVANLLPFMARPMHDVLFNLAGIRTALTKLSTRLSDLVPENPAAWMLRRVQNVIDVRHQCSADAEKRIDLLQLMIEATQDSNQVITFSSMTI